MLQGDSFAVVFLVVLSIRSTLQDESDVINKQKSTVTYIHARFCTIQ